MDKRTNLGMVGGIAGFFLVILLVGIVYAGYNEDLEINGSGTVKLSSWEILFTNVSDATLTGTAVEVTAPEINATKIGDYAVQLTTPGDAISYDITIKNNGTFPAKISSITIPTPECEGSGTSATTDAANVCKHLTYTLVNKPTEPEEATTVSVGDTLNPTESKVFTLTLSYGANVPSAELPKNDVTIKNLAIPIIYIQTTTTE